MQPKQKKATVKRKTKRNDKSTTSSVKPEVTPNKCKPYSDRSGRCPVCQMPFILLSRVESPTWHVDSCLDTPYKGKEGIMQYVLNFWYAVSELDRVQKIIRHLQIQNELRIKVNIANSDMKPIKIDCLPAFSL